MYNVWKHSFYYNFFFSVCNWMALYVAINFTLKIWIKILFDLHPYKFTSIVCKWARNIAVFSIYLLGSVSRPVDKEIDYEAKTIFHATLTSNWNSAIVGVLLIFLWVFYLILLVQMRLWSKNTRTWKTVSRSNRNTYSNLLNNLVLVFIFSFE